jgi:hypothetical protein
MGGQQQWRKPRRCLRSLRGSSSSRGRSRELQELLREPVPVPALVQVLVPQLLALVAPQQLQRCWISASMLSWVPATQVSGRISAFGSAMPCLAVTLHRRGM